MPSSDKQSVDPLSDSYVDPDAGLVPSTGSDALTSSGGTEHGGDVDPEW